MPFLFEAERPGFVGLDALARQFAQRLILIREARWPERAEQFHYRLFAASGYARRCADAVAFHQTAHDLDTFFFTEDVGHATVPYELRLWTQRGLNPRQRGWKALCRLRTEPVILVSRPVRRRSNDGAPGKLLFWSWDIIGVEQPMAVFAMDDFAAFFHLLQKTISCRA